MSDNHANFFLMIPTHIADSEHLNDGEKLFFGRLLSLVNNQGYCCESNSYLADLCGVTEREIRRRLETLEIFGYIIREIELNGPISSRKIYIK